MQIKHFSVLKKSSTESAITTLLHTKYPEKIKAKLKVYDGGACLNKGKVKCNVLHILASMQINILGQQKSSPGCLRGSRSFFHFIFVHYFGLNVQTISQYLYFFGSFNFVFFHRSQIDAVEKNSTSDIKIIFSFRYNFQ